MPPLDTGSATHTLRLVDPLVDRAEPAPEAFQAVGEYLKAVRERRGLSLVEIADATRVRRAYLEAIETAAHASLPSRPFAIGYVRAYAKALDVDAEAAAERYRTEAPDQSAALRAPVGVKHDKPERRPLFFVAAAALVVAVVGWNVAQRVFTSRPAQTAGPAASPQVVEAPEPQGPIALGAPIPPPADQTTPPPYVTPGINGLTGVTGIPAPEAAPAANEALMTPVAPSAYQGGAPPVYAPKAHAYGVEGGPAVVLQARKAASLIIRGPGGEVHFARQLAEGESYRAPVGGKLQAEVTDPAAFNIYVGGQLRGALAASKAPLDRIAAQIAASAPVLPPPARSAATDAGASPAPPVVAAPRDATAPAREPSAARGTPAPARGAAPAAGESTPGVEAPAVER